MILGTSKILTFFGPIIGYFWALGPCISGFSYTKLLQKILESIWEHLEKILFLHVWQSNFSKVFERQTLTFWIYFVYIILLSIFWIYIFKIILWRWGLKMINFPLIKRTEAWIWISYLSKTWIGHLISFLFSGKGISKFFYFQERES